MLFDGFPVRMSEGDVVAMPGPVFDVLVGQASDAMNCDLEEECWGALVEMGVVSPSYGTVSRLAESVRDFCEVREGLRYIEQLKGEQHVDE